MHPDQALPPDRPDPADPEESVLEARVPWREAHPRVARTLLYGLLVLLGTTALLLLQARKRQDEADRLQYLQTRLGMFDLTFGTPQGRQSILETIRDEGMLDPALPATLRQEALRIQAQVLVAEGKREEARARLDEAASLAVDPARALALRIERAELLCLEARGDEALGLLRQEVPWPDALLELARAGEEAYVLETLGRADEARALVEGALARAEAPLPAGEGPRVGLSTLHPGRLATGLTLRLGSGDRPAPPAAWLRLAALVPEDAAALLAAAQALGAAGRGEDAARLRRRAREIDPSSAPSDNPLLLDGTSLEYPLKPVEETGR